MNFSPSIALKVGALSFFLWGVLHLLVGLNAVFFLTDGPTAILSMFQIVPATNELDSNLQNATYLGANFLIDLAAFGILAMWLAVYIWKGIYVKPSYFISLIVLGIVDTAFVLAMVITHISPLSEAIWGPLLYVLGGIFTTFGLVGEQKLPEKI
ncbi:hypothetical protein [Pleionea sp. CnH1-48]|uniref:hypothetical protein n=1 Tax=Pleionea sp. CnH1-48 TaxID=2954494 RepID=UPI002098458D|nr:hypothetical protein [Pleionea sp. CnH1-48]MCO7226048.1 hypothetical protein [Pleionea sp. CnH1-48]